MQIQKKKVNTKGVFSYYQDKNQGSPNQNHSGRKNNPHRIPRVNEDNYGEMQYTQDMSPIYEGTESQSNFLSQRGRKQRARPNDKIHYPNDMTRKDRLIRSPIQINVGEPEYNINRGNSPWERDNRNQMYCLHLIYNI